MGMVRIDLLEKNGIDEVFKLRMYCYVPILAL